MSVTATPRRPATLRRRSTHVLALALLGSVLHAGAAHAGDLTVVVSNLKSATGKVRVGVFKDAGTFPKVDQVLVGKLVPAASGEITVVFPGLPAGDYAVSAFHDLDDNGKLNRNLFGVPSEPYGFSRGARGKSGPPSFDEAKVTVGADGGRIVVEVK